MTKQIWTFGMAGFVCILHNLKKKLSASLMKQTLMPARIKQNELYLGTILLPYRNPEFHKQIYTLLRKHLPMPSTWPTQQTAEVKKSRGASVLKAIYSKLNTKARSLSCKWQSLFWSYYRQHRACMVMTSLFRNTQKTHIGNYIVTP